MPPPTRELLGHRLTRAQAGAGRDDDGGCSGRKGVWLGHKRGCA